jgi:hypothetical protein
MLDLALLAKYMTNSTNESTDKKKEAEYSTIVLTLVSIATISAIMMASRRKKQSNTFTADIILAVFSPVMYWILFAFKVVSH